jgi:hypothetical protein
LAQGGEENRKEQRVRTALRVDLGGEATGVTRDVSASGIFFETEASYARGNSVRFRIDIETPTGPMLLTCRGEVVRLEPRGARLGVAVRIVESSLSAAVAAPH